MDPIQGNLNATDPSNLVGWVSESPGRGTFSIIQSSLLTILICTWTTIHPRIHTAPILAQWHKGMQLIKMILAPEMVCLESLQEFIQANKMKTRTAAATKNELKLVQAYYFGMLGIRYRADKGHKVLWPSQYAWLLSQGLIDWDKRELWGLSEDLIRDKSKADWLVKLTALFQVVWFTLQCVSRAAKNLPICPLETMTLAYVFVTVITYIFWWKKPKDIATAVFVELPLMTRSQRALFEQLAMEDTYDEDEGKPLPPQNAAWYLVARDCGQDQLLLLDKQRILRKAHSGLGEESDSSGDEAAVPLPTGPLRTHLQSSDMQSYPRDPESCNNVAKEVKIITEWDETLYMTRWWPLLCIFGSSFGAFHLISWNSEFPTAVELELWRVSAVTLVVTSLLCMQFRAVSLAWDGPLTLLRVGSPLVYMVCRVIMVVQSFVALRLMPEATYETLAIWSYWLHLF